MSFKVNWDLLNNTNQAQRLENFLNNTFENSPRPDFIGPISISNVSFGNVPPKIRVFQISQPSQELMKQVNKQMNPKQKPILQGDLIKNKLLNELVTLGGSPKKKEKEKGKEKEKIKRKVYSKTTPKKLAFQQLALEKKKMSPIQKKMQQRLSQKSTLEKDLENGLTSLFDFSPQKRRALKKKTTNMSTKSKTLNKPMTSSTTKTQSPPLKKNPKNWIPDINIEVYVDLHQIIHFTLETEFVLNIPRPRFVVLPVRIQFTGIKIHGKINLVLHNGRIAIFMDATNESGKKIDFPIEFQFKTEIGERGKESLNDLSDVEQFILQTMKNLVKERFIYPKMIVI
ncbi:distribution and morphology protein [Anaeramoeba flamelloides]|uniref:Distribution and morphology protein n=1 Tax=Anaeramoeba flamelloides TaxID=1746091 RepID=A0ABQ8Z6L1_9EUKA|nr:distribution and morphology protein [Anaeramoeba flamelloides]